MARQYLLYECRSSSLHPHNENRPCRTAASCRASAEQLPGKDAPAGSNMPCQRRRIVGNAQPLERVGPRIVFERFSVLPLVPKGPAQREMEVHAILARKVLPRE